jgi:phage terminase large subunit
VRIQIKEFLHFGKIVIHPRCKNLIRDLESATWNTDVQSKREDIDYSLCTWGHYDAEATLRYLIRNLSEIPETVDDEIDFSNGAKA